MPYPFALPDLPYGFDALEPHIDARTMEIHHGKHHAAYTTNLNKALESHSGLHGKSIEDLLREIDRVPDSIRTAVRNNGGGFANHTLFWNVMGPGAGGEPGGSLGSAIASKFDSYAGFRDKLTAAATGQFGSGWGWLVVDGSGNLDLYGQPNQDSPYMKGHTPILGVDVWEHAYYLKYQNRRPDYVAAWFNTINWGAVQKAWDAARG